MIKKASADKEIPTMKTTGIALLIGLALALPAFAEPGDYDPGRTVWNLFFPPPADNPVTPEQATGPYPLLVNPEGFDDGFEPGRYLEWQTIQLHPATGAVCGNGSPYKFFVNRAPNTSNMLIYMEGGGACWEFENCTGGSLLGARNPNGIPDDYMSLANPQASLASPFIFRLHPWSRSKVQDWTLVYVPYCTGDIYAGNRVAVYPNPDPNGEPLVWHHNGLRNVRAVVAWLKNHLERPVQLVSTGCSAGGTGSLTNYYHLRRDLEPDFGFMINDSGPIFPTAGRETLGPWWSTRLHTRIKESWGLDLAQEEGISPMELLAQELPGFTSENLGTINRGLAERFPNDRLGHTHFWQDFNYSRYSYEAFYDFIIDQPDPELRKRIIHGMWYADTINLVYAVLDVPNFGFYIPNFRDLNSSHCTTIIDFLNGDIQEVGLELDDFINSVLDGTGPVMQAAELEWEADFNKPLNWLYFLIEELL
jgi:hypothetical protein